MSAWPVVGRRHDQLSPKKIKLAMALKAGSKHYRIVDMQRRHFNAVARSCGVEANMESMISEVIELTPTVVDKVAAELPQNFSGELFDVITKNLRRAADRLAGMPAT
jgi:serine/threonine-protein kinase HipA